MGLATTHYRLLYIEKIKLITILESANCVSAYWTEFCVGIRVYKVTVWLTAIFPSYLFNRVFIKSLKGFGIESRIFLSAYNTELFFRWDKPATHAAGAVVDVALQKKLQHGFRVRIQSFFFLFELQHCVVELEPLGWFHGHPFFKKLVFFAFIHKAS